MIEKRRITALLLLTALGSSSLQAQAVAELWDPKDTSLGQVRISGTAFKNVYVRFQGYFEGLGTLHNPFFTRFTRSAYANFGVWGAEQKLWERKEFDNPISTLFISKSGMNKVLQQIYKLQRYQLIEIVGVVRNIFQGEPWIEVVSLIPQEERVTVSTLAHMNRAMTLMKDHKWAKAGGELSLALTSDIPEKTLAWLKGYLGECLLRTGKPGLASTRLQAAIASLPQEHYFKSLYRELTQDPKAAIDKVLIASRVSREMRPMWEAVEAEEQSAKRRAKRTRTLNKSKSRTRTNRARIPRSKKPARKTKPAEPGK